MAIHEIQTSRGIIRITDDHVFEIEVPNHEQLVLSFTGEKLAFRVGGWVQHAKERGFDGKVLDKPPS